MKRLGGMLLGLLWLAGGAGQAAAGVCGELANHLGPFDYNDPRARAQWLEVVERYHFTPQVEALVRGQSSTVGGDLAYTLGVFPNHHRALYAMINLAQKEPRDPPPGARYTVECWLLRAVTFRGDDPDVRTIYGIYLHRAKRLEAATEQFDAALRLRPGDANAAYNLGLVWLDRGDARAALPHARTAYAQGFPLPGLRERLTALGVWGE